jgi:U3 small nucleolar RNA-associated protein 10
MLESIISSPAVHDTVIERATGLLIKEALSQEENASTARSLLSAIQQRHPNIFHHASRAEQEGDDELKGTIDQLVLSLSLVCMANLGGSDLIMSLCRFLQVDPKARME